MHFTGSFYLLLKIHDEKLPVLSGPFLSLELSGAILFRLLAA